MLVRHWYYFKKVYKSSLFANHKSTNRLKGAKTMKATGIVRRIDDLGRVVIPKEIRRTMHIREGAPLEIFTDTQGGVIFKKYSPVGELSDVTEHYADVLYRSVSTPVLICDRDHVISCAGVSKKDFLDKRISEQLEGLMEERRTFAGDGSQELTPVEGIAYNASIAAPIISNGDVLGAVVFLWSDGSKISPVEIKLAQVAASFLGRQMEE